MAITTNGRKPRQGRAPRKAERPPEPAHGTVKVLRPVGELAPDLGEIAINGKPYLLALLDTAYRLVGLDEKRAATCYDLPVDLSSCDCPDAEFRARPGGCKH